MVKKKIVFFDGDGTLWYPKETRNSKIPHWIYRLPGDHKEHTNHLKLIPGVLSTIRKLKKMGIVIVLLSTHPQDPRKANIIINHKVKHFKLNGLFDEIHATRNYEGSKGDFMVKILKRLRIAKYRALMVGDTYVWDYLSAKNKGIDALLIATDYRKNDLKYKRVRRKIGRLREILDYI